jgi:hypothetical protein
MSIDVLSELAGAKQHFVHAIPQYVIDLFVSFIGKRIERWLG